MAKHFFLTQKRLIPVGDHKLRILILHPLQRREEPVPGVLWIHGGGYQSGSAKDVFATRALSLVVKFGAVLVAPDYRLSKKHPYPAALEDCYAALEYLWHHAEELGVDRKRILVGGESAGGGLAAAVCICARDRGEIPVVFQIPLYPMLDCRDTDSSRHNHALGWGTWRNHLGWRMYLRDLYRSEQVPSYASPSRETDYSGLPPCYTYVEDGEPFRDETLAYIARLKEAGVEAHADVYHGNVHAFDMYLWPTKNARDARQKLIRAAGKYLGEEKT